MSCERSPPGTRRIQWRQDDLKKINPNAHVARIFPIIGIKHWEVEADRKWKGRIVFGGHKVKTATGQWALFQEIGAVPSTMSACRALLAAYAVTRDAKLYQSDCARAYIQAHMKGTDTYVRLPKAWWPKSWGSKYVPRPAVPAASRVVWTSRRGKLLGGQDRQ